MGFGRILAAAAAAVALVAPASLASAQDSRIDGASALAPFARALADLQAGRRAQPVHILQLGDSHSAADHISGALRARLQARFGEGGRGVLPPGRPFAAYNPRQITVEQSDGWRLEASFLPSSWAGRAGGPELAGGSFGLSGWRLTSMRPGATVTVKADPEARFDQAVVCAVGGPNAGPLKARADGDSAVIDLRSASTGPICRNFDYAALRTRLTLEAVGPTTLLSVATFRKGGVALSNLGVIGAQLKDFAGRDDRVLAAELAAYRPDLIILAFGTNEGFEKALAAEDYERLAEAQLRRLKRLAPGAAILVMGPPDADTVRPDIPEDGKADLGFACLPLTPAEIADYPRLILERSAALARWYPPPNLDLVRNAQRRAASTTGAAFWDWGARLGGPCSAHAFSKADPRLVRGDHIHFTTAGGEWVADLLSGDLISAYGRLAGQR